MTLAQRRRQRILILGGGFGGVKTAMTLHKSLKYRDDVEIAMVNAENYTVFQPMLAEVISGSLSALDTVVPIRDLCPGIKLYVRRVESIDLDRKVVLTSYPSRPQHDEIAYDHLVLALGSVDNFSLIRGLSEHGLHFKNLGDALVIRNHIIKLLEQADVEQDDEMRQKMLTFVVAGGEFSGVEAMAEINDYVRDVMERYANLDPEQVNMILLQEGERILPGLPAPLSLYAQYQLRERQVDVRLNTRLAAVTADEAILDDGTRIPTQTLIATLLAAPNPVLMDLPCQKTAGRITTDEYLEVPEYPGVWAIGDCAHILDYKSQETCPPTAQYAVREAKCCANNILATLDHSRDKLPFAFSSPGVMGPLGKHTAVAEVLGIKMSGFFAWLIWRALYWSKLPGFNRKARVAVSWFLRFFLPHDIAHLNVAPSQDLSRQHFEAGEIIIRQGEPGDRMYIITKGEAEVVVEQDGGEHTVATRSQGDCLGEMALIDEAPRNATIRALTSLSAIVVQRHAFSMLFDHMPKMRDSLIDMARERTVETHRSLK